MPIVSVDYPEGGSAGRRGESYLWNLVAGWGEFSEGRSAR